MSDKTPKPKQDDKKPQPKTKVQRIGRPVGLDPKDLKNEEERANYVQAEMEKVCAMAGMKIEAVVVPQLRITAIRQGTLQECLDDYNKQQEDAKKGEDNTEAPEEEKPEIPEGK